MRLCSYRFKGWPILCYCPWFYVMLCYFRLQNHETFVIYIWRFEGAGCNKKYLRVTLNHCHSECVNMLIIDHTIVIDIYWYINIIISFLFFIVTQDLPTHILINLYPGIFPHAGKNQYKQLAKKKKAIKACKITIWSTFDTWDDWQFMYC